MERIDKDMHMNAALIHRLERSLSLTCETTQTSKQPCRAGELFRMRFGDRFFALKLYDYGYFNDLYLYRALAATKVPVPLIHGYDESPDLVGKPWILMDWLEGSHHVTDLRAVGRQVGRLMREIHTVAVDGAGARGQNTWEFPDWHTLVEVQANRDYVEISRFEDAQAYKGFYLTIVDEFVRLGRLQPNQSFLLHGDLGLDNIIVANNTVAGVIDAGWIVGGNPLMDVSYVMNSRLAVGEGMRGLLEGLGISGLDEYHDVKILRLYQWLGKLIHFSSTGQREKYEQRRQLLFEFAIRHGFWSGPPANVT